MGTISVSLPSDGTTADVADYNTPVTTIVNEFNGNIDNANIKTGAAIATSKLADDAGITGAKLATSAITLGYAQITANFTTTATSATQVTSLSASVTIPAGGRRVRITAFAEAIYTGTNGQSAKITIWDGTVGSGTQLSQGAVLGPTAIAAAPVTIQAIVTPAAGAKTYNVGLHVAGGGATGTLEAAATYPAFIHVEAV